MCEERQELHSRVRVQLIHQKNVRVTPETRVQSQPRPSYNRPPSSHLALSELWFQPLDRHPGRPALRPGAIHTLLYNGKGTCAEGGTMVRTQRRGSGLRWIQYVGHDFHAWYAHPCLHNDRSYRQVDGLQASHAPLPSTLMTLRWSRGTREGMCMSRSVRNCGCVHAGQISEGGSQASGVGGDMT